MPREERYRCFWCEGQINYGDRKYWAGGSLLLRVFLATNSGRRVNPDDSICGACRRRYARWQKAMQNDFDHLDVPVNKTDSQENEESMLMEVDTDIVTENEDIESEKEMKSVTLSIWRTSKSHGSSIVCPVADSTSMWMRVLSDEQRTMSFLSRSIWVPKGARCCSNHLYKGHLSYEARQSVKQSKVDDIILNKHNVEKLIDNFCLTLKHAGSLDFDDPGALDNISCKNTSCA
ncbi:unnamed protein product [Rotaria magnacalcarata]|uniref:Uncharacterized protein n=2 Tax=Rotaria magnacalcarata TaxID=392030 RepID=A0A816FH44_9BILA|nr:unnamed protein product [Rotaria magnacalcarata]CAF4029885.1 unnamed protein product [Rotaria magnacalcarata]